MTAPLAPAKDIRFIDAAERSRSEICMHAVRENDIVDGSVQIPMRMIWEFGCTDGWIGIVRYDSFARLIDNHTTGGEEVYAHGAISYGIPGPKLIEEIFQGTFCNLLIKTRSRRKCWCKRADG